MAVYKVPQDVEAEDKLLGPLTFKQFIFMMIAAGASLMSWLLFSIQPLLALMPAPVILIFGGLAVFRREDQPVERYLLSFFNFWLRPRTRLWSTEGYYDHLIITAPKKKAAPELKSNLDQVHGQLEKLARIVDTRGWAAKQPNIVMPNSDDRLFMPEAPAQTADTPEDNEDIMDDNNPEALQLDTILKQQAAAKRDQLIKQAQSQAKTSTSTTPDPYPAQHRINPDGSTNIHPSLEQANTTPKPPETTQDRSDILELSDELTVSQIQAQVNRDSDQRLTEGEEIKLR